MPNSKGKAIKKKHRKNQQRMANLVKIGKSKYLNQNWN